MRRGTDFRLCESDGAVAHWGELGQTLLAGVVVRITTAAEGVLASDGGVLIRALFACQPARHSIAIGGAGSCGARGALGPSIPTSPKTSPAWRCFADRRPQAF